MVKKTIGAALTANVPVLIWGGPGTGKSVTLEVMARAAGAYLEVQVAGRMDPTDLGLLFPHPQTGRLITVAPDWMVRLQTVLETGSFNGQEYPGGAWLFLDELTTATPPVLAGLLRLVQEREAGGIKLPQLRIVAAANPAAQAAGAAMDLDEASEDRWLHLLWEVDLNIWLRELEAGWNNEQSSARGAARHLIANFVRRAPTHLGGALPPGWGVTWGRVKGASPRSWDALTAILAHLLEQHPQEAHRKVLLRPEAKLAALGLLGNQAATEFFAYAAHEDLPDPEVLLGPEGTSAMLDGLVGGRLIAAIDSIFTAVQQDRPDRAQRAIKMYALLAGIERKDTILKSDLARWTGYFSTHIPEVFAVPEFTEIVKGLYADFTDLSATLEDQQPRGAAAHRPKRRRRR